MRKSLLALALGAIVFNSFAASAREAAPLEATRVELLTPSGSVVFSGSDGLFDRVFIAEKAIIRVLAHPEQYNGKKVELIGYYQSGLEENALYLTKEDSKNSNYENSIWIGGIAPNANPDRIHHFKNGFIRVIGTFSYGSRPEERV